MIGLRCMRKTHWPLMSPYLVALSKVIGPSLLNVLTVKLSAVHSVGAPYVYLILWHEPETLNGPTVPLGWTQSFAEWHTGPRFNHPLNPNRRAFSQATTLNGFYDLVSSIKDPDLPTKNRYPLRRPPHCNTACRSQFTLILKSFE